MKQKRSRQPKTAQTREGIIAAVEQACWRRTDVLFAYLFGSHARGKTGPLSDIDLALYFDPRASVRRREKTAGDIGEEIVRALHVRGERPVQIQILNELQETHHALEHAVVYEGIRIFCRDEAARAHYEAAVIHRWIAWLPHQEKFNKATLAHLSAPLAPYRVYAQ